jgi:hypothetical protein
MIPGSANPLLLASAAAAGGYQIERSLRFNSADSAYLSRTPASSSNRTTWTWAGWVKRSAVSSGNQRFFGIFQGGVVQEFFVFNSGDTLRIAVIQETKGFTTTQVFRDPSAWYHIVVVLDTPQATASDRLKLYVNGTQVTTFSSTDYPVQNSPGDINNTYPHFISNGGGGEYFNGYMADIHFIDGQALTPSSFTEVSATTGQLIPKAYSGTYGTNGFYLQFSDNSAATASTLGKDTSGNGNNWTPNNFSVISTSGPSYTPTSNTNLYGMTWADVFKPNNPAGVYSQDNTLATGTLATSKAYSSSVELLCCSTNSSAPIYANGVAVSSPPGGNNISSAQWRTVLTGSGTLTSVGVQSDGGERGILFQIRVDGTQLVNVIASECDSLVDTPTSYGTDTGVGNEVRGNYATLNPLYTYNGTTLRNGNLDFLYGSGQSSASATMSAYSGKYYCEMTPTTINAMVHFGVFALGGNSNGANIGAGQTSRVIYLANGGCCKRTTQVVELTATYTTNDIVIANCIKFRCFATNSCVTFYKNGSQCSYFRHNIRKHNY